MKKLLALLLLSLSAVLLVGCSKPTVEVEETTPAPVVEEVAAPVVEEVAPVVEETAPVAEETTPVAPAAPVTQ